MTRGPGALAALALLSLLAAACTRSTEGSRQLEADVPRWAVAGFDLEFDVRIQGAIGERNAAVAVFLDGKRIGRFPQRDKRVRVSIPGSRLRAGERTIRLKTGHQRASADIVVLSRGAVGGVAGGLVAVGLLLGWLARRRTPADRG